MSDGYLKFMVLKLLVKNPLSGYILMKSVQECTGRKPSPGSMYPLLKSLKEKGLLTEKSEGRSKVYMLTVKGREAAANIEQQHEKMVTIMQQNIRLMQSVIGEHDAGPLEIIKRVQKGQAPFGRLTPDLIALRDLFLKMADKELTEKQQQQISDAVRETIRKVKSVCSR